MFYHYPIFNQDDERSCGAYCIKMILKYHGVDEDITPIKQKLRIDTQGATIRGLMMTLVDYHCEVKAFHGQLDDLSQIPLPCILHLVKDQMGHFVVLYQIKDDCYIIGDPAKGLVTYEKDELQELYSGNFVAIYHVGRVNQHTHRSLLRFLKTVFFQMRNEINHLILYGLFLSGVAYFLSYFYGYLIDALKPKTPMIVVILSLAIYSGLQLLKIMMSSRQDKQQVILTRCLNKRYINQAVNCLSRQRCGDEATLKQSQVLDLYDLIAYCAQFFQVLAVSGLTCIILNVGLCLLSLPIGIIVLLGHLMTVVLMKRMHERILPVYKESLSQHNQHVSALLSCLKDASMGFRYEKHQWLKRYEEAYERDEEVKMTYQLSAIREQKLIRLWMMFVTMVIFVIAIMLYRQSRLSLGQVFMILTMTEMMHTPIIELSMLVTLYQQASVLYDRLKSFLQNRDDDKVSIEEPVCSFTIRNLSYSYGYHEDIIHHLNLSISKNTMIKGANGTGKTTLLKLLSGMDDVYRGDILINKQPLKSISQSSLDDHIIYVSANETFITGTVIDNLYCDDLKRIESTFSLLGVPASKINDYLSTAIMSDGSPLSSGQRQLIALARALLKQADVYLLDEALCHLPQIDAMNCLKKIQEAYPESLFVIVAHDLNDVNITESYAIMGA